MFLFGLQATRQFFVPNSSSYQNTSSGYEQYSSAIPTEQYYQPVPADQSGQVVESSQPSIADMLAAASDRVVERCGYEYHEGLDMYYDANSGLYYHQVSL